MTTATQQALLNTASRLREQGQVPEAIDAYRTLLAAYPDLPESWYNLGWLLRYAGLAEEALTAYAEALRRGVSGPEEVHLNRAVLLSDALARPDAARAELDRALEIDPAYMPALINLGNLHEDLGQRSEAAAAYERALALSPGNATALSRLAGLKRTVSPDDPLLSRIQSVVTSGTLLAADHALLLFAFGRLHDLAGHYDAAAKAFEAANQQARIASAGMIAPYNGIGELQRADHLGQIFKNIASAPAGIEFPEPQPVFIVGMFRSGSTLIEQMLGMHARIQAGGELDLLPRIVEGLGHSPALIAAAPADQIKAYAEAYLTRARSIFPDATIVTDKRPDNFWHIGLIKRLFPKAKIINTVRHPLDTLISVWGLYLDAALNYSFSIPDIAAHIHAERRMMVHWHHLYPGDILTVRYEDVIARPEAEIRRTLEFLGLPFDPQCLAFHASSRPVRTASVWQVREPLNDRSIGRWKHYEAYLRALPPDPALDGLLKAAEQMSQS